MRVLNVPLDSDFVLKASVSPLQFLTVPHASNPNWYSSANSEGEE